VRVNVEKTTIFTANPARKRLHSVLTVSSSMTGMWTCGVRNHTLSSVVDMFYEFITREKPV